MADVSRAHPGSAAEPALAGKLIGGAVSGLIGGVVFGMMMGMMGMLPMVAMLVKSEGCDSLL